MIDLNREVSEALDAYVRKVNELEKLKPYPRTPPLTASEVVTEALRRFWLIHAKSFPEDSEALSKAFGKHYD